MVFSSILLAGSQYVVELVPVLSSEESNLLHFVSFKSDLQIPYLQGNLIAPSV